MLAILASLLVFSCYSQPSYYSVYLDSFPEIIQKKSQLCWATTYQMVQNYAEPNSKISQCDVINIASDTACNKCKPNCKPNCSSKSKHCKMSTYNSGIAKNDYYATFGITPIAPTLAKLNNILKNKSLIIGEGYKVKTAAVQYEEHFVAGYGTETADRNEFILVQDPYKNTLYSLFGKHLVELRYNLPEINSIESIISIGIINKSKNNKIKRGPVKKFPHAHLISLNQNRKDSLCKLNKCYNIEYNYIYKGAAASIIDSVFEVYNTNSKTVTKFMKINNVWEPMAVFELNNIFGNISFTIPGLTIKGGVVIISKKKNENVKVLVNGKSIEPRLAFYPPSLYTFMKFEYKGDLYVVDDRLENIKIMPELQFIKNILENANQHH